MKVSLQSTCSGEKIGRKWLSKTCFWRFQDVSAVSTQFFSGYFVKNAGFPHKIAISKKSLAIRNFLTTIECCIGREKRKLGEIWAFYRESYEKGKQKFGRFGKKVRLTLRFTELQGSFSHSNSGLSSTVSIRRTIGGVNRCIVCDSVVCRVVGDLTRRPQNQTLGQHIRPHHRACPRSLVYRW